MVHNGPMADIQDPITTLEEDTCWGYLASVDVGRLALAIDGQPEVYPINFVLDGQSIVFRSAEGSKLREMALNNRVAFEADGWDEDGGWSVLVRGTGAPVTDEAELARCDKMPLRPWVPTVKKTYVRVIPESVSGRGFLFGPEPKA